MSRIKNCTRLIIFVVNVLVGLHAFGFPACSQEMYRMRLQHAVEEADNPQKFWPFIKEREYTDSPYEIASPEAQQLLDFIERTMIPSTKWDERWARGFISQLRKGEVGRYLKISHDVYIVKFGLSMWWVANIKKSTFDELVVAYDIAVVEKGLLPDGTGWLLCYSWGMSHGQKSSGYTMVTYGTFGGETTVKNTGLVGEVMAYTEDLPIKGSFEYYCGEGEDRIKGVAGEILGYSWEEVGSSGARKIQFTVTERDCDNRKSVSVKKTIGFIVSGGEVKSLKGK